MSLIINYKLEIHKRKGKKNENHILTSWKNDKGEWITERTFCCEQMKNAISHGFISIETDQRNFADIKYNDKQLKLDHPVVCLFTFSDTGYDDEGCPHEESTMPINNCPFCCGDIKIICLGKKKIIHECIKVKREYEECEDKIIEVIL